MDIGNAELVPEHEVFNFPIKHAVYKGSSTTTKIRAVFDSFAMSSSSFSFYDTLLVGPNFHSSLINVLLQFHIAITVDVSNMYRTVELTKPG